VSGRLLNPANLLTLSRLPLAFAFAPAYAAGAGGSRPALLAATAIAGAIELTDLVDGTVARRLRCVTDFGKLVDPFADSFARLAVFFTLAAVPFAGGGALVPLWVPLVLLLRDLGVSFLRSIAAARGIVIAARTSGKIKAFVQGPAILAVLGIALLAGKETAARAGPWLGAVAAVVTLWSLVDYFAGNRPVLRDLAVTRPPR